MSGKRSEPSLMKYFDSIEDRPSVKDIQWVVETLHECWKAGYSSEKTTEVLTGETGHYQEFWPYLLNIMNVLNENPWLEEEG